MKKHKLVSWIASVGLAFAVMLSVSTTAAGTELDVAGESIKSNGRIELGAGAISSDICGGKKLGPAICVNSVKEYSNSRVLLRLGLEYNRKSGSGEATHRKMATGELLYQGQADVFLHYLQATASMGYYLVKGKFDIAPYLGIGPTLLVSQRIDPVEPAQAGAFDDYRAYSSFDFLVLGGAAIRYSRLVLDLQFTQGLIDLVNSVDDGLDYGKNLGGTTLLDGNRKSQSIRVALGICF